MNDINQEIQIAFQATQLILVFVTVLFSLRYPQIQKDIKTIIPTGNRVKEKNNLRTKFYQSIKVKCIPLLLINGIASYLFFPLFVQVLATSKIDLWNFDFARTSFMFIALLIFVFFLWSVYLTLKLYLHIQEFDETDDAVKKQTSNK